MKIKPILFSIGAFALSVNANAKVLTIGIDLSGSNPLLSHENFSYSVARYAGDEIKHLKSVMSYS